MKALLKEKIIHGIHNRKVILFGAAKVAENFYTLYKNKIAISYCVSNFESEWGENAFLGEKDVFKFDADMITGNEYFIVCGPFAFKQIEKQLIECGLKPYEDFMVSSIVEAVIENKKICMFRGSCVLRDIYECIVQLPEFSREYYGIYSTDNYSINKTEDRVFYYGKDICDAYIYSYRVLRQNKEYLWSQDEIAEGARIMSVSNITFPGYWPQADPEIRNANRYLVHPYNIKRDLVFYHTVYRMEDLEINRMIDENKTAQQIYAAISNDDYFTQKQVTKNSRLAFKSISISENNATIKIEDFIRDKYKEIRVFQNFSHMHKSVIWEMVRRIIKQLGITDENIDKYEELSPKYIHHGGDIPIYPSVANWLELEMVNIDTKYEVLTYQGIKDMNLEEYVYHYYEYTKLAKKMIEGW